MPYWQKNIKRTLTEGGNISYLQEIAPQHEVASDHLLAQSFPFTASTQATAMTPVTAPNLNLATMLAFVLRPTGSGSKPVRDNLCHCDSAQLVIKMQTVV